MKKKSITLLLLLLLPFLAIATEQYPDVIFINGKEHKLDIGWGHPSPLQTYYSQKSLDYPFTMISTANYRGHIATWKIENSRFYLTKIDVDGEEFEPLYFNVASENKGFSTKEKVFADWFSGVLVSRKINKDQKYVYTAYHYVKKGIVERETTVSDADMEKIQQFSAKDTSNVDLYDKYTMLYLNQSYIAYYFRLNDDEMIEINGKKGQIASRKGGSLVLELFENNHLKWPYNWENFEMNGAPNGIWKVENNKLLLETLHVHTGLDFYETNKFQIPLEALFKPERFQGKSVFAEWISGVYLIHHGEEEKDELVPSFTRFKVTGFTIVRVEKGKVLESYPISKDQKIDDLSKIKDEKLRQIIEDYKNQK